MRNERKQKIEKQRESIEMSQNDEGNMKRKQK